MLERIVQGVLVFRKRERHGLKGPNPSSLLRSYYFLSKIIFRNENIQFSGPNFFLFLILPMTRRLFRRIVGVLIIHTCGVLGKPEVAGSNSAVGHHFQHIFRHLLTNSCFLKNKNGFPTKIKVFSRRSLFLKSILFRRN